MPKITFYAALLTTLMGLALSANAQSESTRAPVCEGPVATCGFGPLDGNLSPIDPQQACPSGYTCTCVPSCPVCADCAASVCVRAPERECNTACDCDPGLGCFEGRCLAGFAPVYCCDADPCPLGDQCQHLDGTRARCEDRMEPSCRERLVKAQTVIARLVERGSRCREDSDCVQIATTTHCRGTCGEVVNRRAARKISRHIARLDRKVCNDYQADGCPFATPSCAPVDPVCVENRCVGELRLRSEEDVRR